MGYFTNNDGVWMDGDPPTKILDVRLDIIDVGQTSDGHCATIKWTTQRGTEFTKTVPLTLFGDRHKARDWLLSNAIMPAAGPDSFVAFGTDRLRKILAERDPTRISNSFGWRDDGAFILGRNEIRADTVHSARIDESMVQPAMTDGLMPKGSLDAWADATREFTGFHPQAFSLLASLAAPVLDIMQVSGCVLSVAGPANTGKTTAMNYAMSVWGLPGSLVIAADSTLNSRGAKLRCAKNIPIGIDDLSRHIREVNGLMYMVANGKEKSRATVTGAVRDGGEWCTVLYVTTNFPLLDLPRRELGEAERRRIVELVADKPFDRQAAVRLNNTMRENYGVAAIPYVQYLMRNREDVKKRGLAYWDEFSEMFQIPEANRFGSWLLAAASVAGDIATHLGLIKFDHRQAIDFVGKELSDHGHSIQVDTLSALHLDDMLVDYTRQNFHRLSVIKNDKFVQLPEDLEGILGCYDINGRTLRIKAAPLRAWMIEQGGIAGYDWRTWIKSHRFNFQAAKLHPHEGGVSRCLMYREFTHRLPVAINKEGKYGVLPKDPAPSPQ